MSSETGLNPIAVKSQGARKGAFRPDIQGLRALAVVAVIFDHLLGWPSGGFVGVDVFFVISGFLITGLLLREHEKTGRISFLNFYRRRVKRILPAATVVLAVTIAAAYFIYNSGRFVSTLIDGLWSLLFAANWRFAIAKTDYFQAHGPVSALQHYWSLSVEEQFYFVWPWLMLAIFLISAAARRGHATGRAVAGVAMVVITVASFSWAVYETQVSAATAYFSTFSRAWELGIGALIAVYAPVARRIPAVLRPVLGWAGLAGIVFSLFVVNDRVAFPAPWAALPVLSAALVIIAGTGGTQRFLAPLTNTVAGYLGDISYSLYLWHFPVIILLAEFFRPGDVGYFVLASVLILASSVLSYHLIEDPVRKSAWLSPPAEAAAIAEARTAAQRSRRLQRGRGESRLKRWAIPLLGLEALVVAALVAAAFVPRAVPTHPQALVPVPTPSATASAPATAAEELQQKLALAVNAKEWPSDLSPAIDQVASDLNPEMQQAGCLNPPDLDDQSVCTFGSGDRSVVVVGDSFAVAWMPAVRGAFEPRGYTVRGIGFSTCPFSAIVMKIESGQKATDLCNDSRAREVELINTLEPDVVIVVDSEYTFGQTAVSPDSPSPQAAWVDGRVEILDAVKAEGRRIILLSPNPSGQDPAVCVTRVSTPADCLSQIGEGWQLKAQADRAAAEAAGVEYFDTSSWFCTRTWCPIFAGTAPMRWDVGHLTPEYSSMIAPALGELLFPGETATAAP
ncbi:acyltransferase [Naasia aerilata]|uniref:Acyltransferase n=2 Tax=Naasia aerilata TaxID=1162966 RepID=A0ABN6XJP6_9MICO|nr:acyltransferase [Naasia aerilata]